MGDLIQKSGSTCKMEYSLGEAKYDASALDTVSQDVPSTSDVSGGCLFSANIKELFPAPSKPTNTLQSNQNVYSS